MVPVQSSRLRQIFGDLEVVEAAEKATIVVTPEDITYGVPGDPHNCAFALASRRAWGGNHTDVAFLRGVAYVTFTDRNGSRRSERFVMSASTKRLVKAFDAGGKPEPGEYKLLPPPPSQTVEAGHARAKAQREQAKAEGRKMVHKPRGPLDPLSFKRLAAFRNGEQWPPATDSVNG